MIEARGNHAIALSEYRRILQSDPSQFSALVNVLQDCRTRGDAAEAIVLANRALAHDDTNFIALDGLAWAFLKQGDYHQAKTATERALKAIDSLDVGEAFRSLFVRITTSVMRLVLRLPGLRKRYPRLRSTSEMEARAAEDVAEWRAWALEYLAWYDGEYGRKPDFD
jgi:tetratricopeptide (TPR) repeat protein